MIIMLIMSSSRGIQVQNIVHL